MSAAKNISKQGNIFHPDTPPPKPGSGSSLEQVREILMGEDVRQIHLEIQTITKKIQSLTDAQKRSHSELSKIIEENVERLRQTSEHNRATDLKEQTSLRVRNEQNYKELKTDFSNLRSTNVTRLQLSSFLRSWAETFESSKKGT